MPEKKKKGGKAANVGRRLRNANILAGSASGKTGRELADEFGLDERQISRILTTEESQAIFEAAESDLRKMVVNAVETLLYAMENKQEFGVIGAAVKSAQIILKKSGNIKDESTVTLQPPTTPEEIESTKRLLLDMPDDQCNQ